MSDPVAQFGFVAMSLVPAWVAVRVVLARRAWDRMALAEVKQLASERDLALAPGATAREFTLTGSCAGLPLSIAVHPEPSKRGKTVVTRVRLLTPNREDRAGSFRDDPRADSSRSLIIARDEAIASEAVVGLVETPIGDPELDRSFRGYAAPGLDAPWADPAVRTAFRSLATTRKGLLRRIERSVHECCITFAGVVPHRPLLERAIAIASALASGVDARAASGRADRDAALTPPLVWPGASHDERLSQAKRLALVSLGGALLLGWLLTHSPFPTPAIVDRVVCDDEEGAGFVNYNGSVGLYCGNSGDYRWAGPWNGLISFDIAFALLAIPTTVAQAVRRRRGRGASAG